MHRTALALVLLLGATACAPAAGDPDDAGPRVTTAAPTTVAPPAPRYVFPVAARAKYGRAHHDYPAADVFAPCGSAFLAPTAGTVTEVSLRDAWSSKENDGAERGGLSVTLQGTDGVRYYGSHLRAVAPAVKPGLRVGAGARLGEVGDTGSARGIACHLHFGISPASCTSGDWWIRRGVVPPYEFLRSWQKKDQASPVATVEAWKKKRGCPPPPES